MSREIPTLDVRKLEVRAGDFKQALWTQYMNCVNSMNTLETEAETRGAQGLQVSTMESHVSIEKFIANVDILESMCEGYDLLDSEYGEAAYGREWSDSRKAFSKLTKLLKRKVFAERAADLGTLSA
jgi:hypothetical protein